MKPGYKQTEVGVIPEEWEVKGLGEEIDRLDAGVSVNSVNEDLHSSGSEKAVLKTSSIVGGVFFPNEIKKIALRDIGRAKLNPRFDSIIISRMNTPELVGECGYVFADFPNLFLPDRIWMTRHRQGNHTSVRWLNYLLSSRPYRTRIKELATGTSGSMKNIAKNSLLAMEITYPPLPEQRAIAGALSDVDALLGAQEALLAKKRDLKAAAMQQLLTGETRLPGFTGEWQVKRLGEALHFQVGFPFSSAFFNEQELGIRLIKNRDLKSDDQVFHYCGSYDSAFLVKNGDVLIGMDGDFLPCRWAKGTALLNQRVGRIAQLDGLDIQFAYYYLLAPLKEIELMTASTTVKHLSHSDIEGIEKPLPSLPEQTAIAAVLSDMDAEIVALEAQRDKTRALKQGMMQELLTGRIRLI